MIRIVSSLAALALLTSCATGPVPATERRPVAPDRVYAPELLVASGSRTAPFSIVRDRGPAGVLAGVNVFIDGQKIARLASSEVVTVFASPGKHIVGARFSYGPIGPAEHEFVADPKKPLTIRVYTEGNATSLDLRPETGFSCQ